MTEQCYSADGESYHSDMQSAIYECEVGDTIYVGESYQPCPSAFVPDADWIINHMQEQAYDEFGEYADGFCEDVSDEVTRELDEFLTEWAKKHVKVTFYRVKNEREYVLTKEDF